MVLEESVDRGVGFIINFVRMKVDGEGLIRLVTVFRGFITTPYLLSFVEITVLL